MRGYKFVLAFLACTAAGAAQAFNIVANSENPLVDQAALTAATQKAAADSGARIPDDPNVKVTVFTRAAHIPGRDDNAYLYLHRIELRRAFNGPNPPYPYAGWLPIETVERYGYGKDGEVKGTLDKVLHDFFTRLQPVDPNAAFK